MPRVLLLLPQTSYRARDFLAAAERLKVDVVAASDIPNVLTRMHPETLLTLKFRDLEATVRAVREYHRTWPIDAVIPVDEDTAVAAAAIGEALALKHNSVESALAARDKHRFCRILQGKGVPVPNFRLTARSDDPAAIAQSLVYPCVLKPLSLTGSRGVIRADDPGTFVAAWRRIESILDARDVAARGKAASAENILVQEFVPGAEFALEGLLSGGRLQVLALFDKPDPLDGPFFEETIYVTPSRHGESVKRAISDCVTNGADALGIREGPVHAEVRFNERGAYLIELAARSIGGLCSRTLRFGTGLSLEDLILQHALGMDVQYVVRESQAAGVMMIPIGRPGILEDVRGLKDARSVPGIEEISITATMGKPVVPLPEGSSYLGFILARRESPDEVEGALRTAHQKLELIIS